MSLKNNEFYNLNNTNMSAGKIKNNQYYFDCVSVLDAECDLIIENAVELDRYAMLFDVATLDSGKYLRVENLVNFIYNRIYKLYKMEEDYIFPEMKQVMPEQSSIDAMRGENKVIMSEYIPIKELLSDRENINSHKEELQILVITWVDLIQRAINKKENILYPEIYRLSEVVTDKIYDELMNTISKEAAVN